MIAASIVITADRHPGRCVTELRQTIRERREPLTQQEALEGLRTVFSGAIFGWIGLAAIALLLPRLWRDSNLSGWGTVLILALLAFAGDRAYYLVTPASNGTSRRARLGGITRLMSLKGQGPPATDRPA